MGVVMWNGHDTSHSHYWVSIFLSQRNMFSPRNSFELNTYIMETSYAFNMNNL